MFYKSIIIDAAEKFIKYLRNMKIEHLNALKPLRRIKITFLNLISKHLN